MTRTVNRYAPGTAWLPSIALALVVMILSSCSREPERAAIYRRETSLVTVLLSEVASEDQVLAKRILAELFPAAEVYKASDAAEAMKQASANDRVLVLVDPAHLPISQWEPLRNYIEHGGPVLLWGENPFQPQSVRGVASEGEVEGEVDARLEAAREVDGFSSIQAWQHRNEMGQFSGTVRVSKHSDLPWAGVQVQAEQFNVRDVMQRSAIPAGTISMDENSLVLHARGIGAVRRLFVTCRENDGSQWTHPIPLSNAWQPFVLHEAEFEYDAGGTDRDGEGDHLELGNLQEIAIGLSKVHEQLPDGPHQYELSDVRVAMDYRPPELEAARHVEPVSSVQVWQHRREGGVHAGTVRIARDAKLPWPGVLVEADGFRTEDVMKYDDIPEGLIGAGENAIVFHARGHRPITRLVVTCVEADGSVWRNIFRVGESWKAHVLNEASFEYAKGGESRGGSSDHLDLTLLKRISIGLHMSHTPVPPGDRKYELSDVRFSIDTRPSGEVSAEPDFFLCSPSFRRFNLQPKSIRALQSGRNYPVRNARVQSPIPAGRGAAADDISDGRWIPLFQGVDQDGTIRGWPASMYIRTTRSRGLERWAWIAVDPTPGVEPACKAMLRDTVHRLRAPYVLLSAGADRFVFRAGEQINITARWKQLDESDPAPRIIAELRGDGRLLRRVIGTADNMVEPGLVRLNLGVVPSAHLDVVDRTLSVTLESPTQRGHTYDEITQKIKWFPEETGYENPVWLATTAARFTFRRRPVFLLGTEYAPLNRPKGHTASASDWLSAASFDPVLIRRDLEEMKASHINAIALTYDHPDQSPQLQWIINEARNRGLWVRLTLGRVPSLDEAVPQMLSLLRAAQIQEETHVFAIDAPWVPPTKTREERRVMDAAWEAWLLEQYGSLDQAETLLGRPIWREEGQIAGPPDLAPDDLAMMAYRRFLQDHVSRGYGFIKRALGRAGYQQMLGARFISSIEQHGGNESSIVDLLWGAVHLDFLTAVAGGVYGDMDEFHELGFVTAYARGITDGKPVVWMNFGASVGRVPMEDDLANQARVYSNMFETVLNSRAAGALGRAYVGRYDQDWREDFGIVNPDGSKRPAIQAHLSFARGLRRERQGPQSWRGRRMNLTEASYSFARLWDTWRDVYRDEMAAGDIGELRPATFGMSTKDVDLISLSGQPYQDPAPFADINAEWGAVEVDAVFHERKPGSVLTLRRDQQVHLNLINSGWTTWAASSPSEERTVWVRFTHESGRTHDARVGDVKYGQQARVIWTPTQTGHWHVRPYLWAVGAFGERLDVLVEERGNDAR